MKKWIFIALFCLPFAFANSSTVPVEKVILAGGPGFTLNPNPVNGSYFFINLEFSEKEFPNTQILITNVLGQVVYSYGLKHIDFENGKVRVDVSDAKLDKGVYFVQLKSGDYTKTLKLAVR